MCVCLIAADKYYMFKLCFVCYCCLASRTLYCVIRPYTSQHLSHHIYHILYTLYTTLYTTVYIPLHTPQISVATYSLENMRDRRALFTLTDRLLRLKYLYTQLDLYRNSTGSGNSTGSNQQIYTTTNANINSNGNGGSNNSSNTIKITITPSSDYSSYTSSSTSHINIQTTDPSSTNQQYPSQQSSTLQQHEDAILSSPILKQAKINQIESEIILWYQQFLLYYNINNLTINDINLFITCINQSLLINDINGPIISTTSVKTGTGAAAKPEKNTGTTSYFGSFFSSMMTQNSDPRNISEYIDYIKKRYNNNTSMFSIFDSTNTTTSNTNNNSNTTNNTNNNNDLNVDIQVYKLLYSIMMLDKNLYYLSNEMKILEKTV